MESEKPTYEDLTKRIHELEILAGFNRQLQPKEAAIFEHEEFTRFINLTRDGKIIGNRNGIIIGWNNAMEQITGYRAIEVIGKHLWEIKYLLTPEAEKTPELLAKLQTGTIASLAHPETFSDQIHEFSIKRNNGEIRHLEDHSSIITSPDGPYFLSITRDITDKIKAENALRESEERHRGLLNSLELGILVYTKTGDITLANPKSCSLFDLFKPENEAYYRFKNELELLSENHSLLDDETCPVRKIIRTKQGLKNFLMGTRAKGETEIRWLMLNGYPEFNEYGEVEEVIISLLDISERRKIVQALHIKNVALDSSILAVGTTDLQGRLNYVNPALVKLWGFESDLEMIGYPAIQFWNDPIALRNLIEKAFREGSATGENWGKRKDDSLFPVSCKISTIVDEKNEFIGLVGSFEDLSELKKSQQALQESEDKFKSIANYSASWEAWFDENGKLIWMNPYSLELTGYTVEEYLSETNFYEFAVYHEDLPRALTLLEDAKKGSSGENFEIRCNKKDGGIVWISISWRPIYNSEGKSIGIRTSGKDITDKIKANHELEKSKKQYDNLVANIDVGVFILHEKPGACLYFDYVSPKFSELVHASISSIMADASNALKRIHPDEWDAFRQKNAEAQLNLTILDWEGRIVLDDQTCKWIHIISKPEKQVDGDVLWHGLLIDTTETKMIQDEIALKNTQLLKVISEKDKFFSIIAHDLRNPFNAFLGLTKIMVEDFSSLSRDEIHEFAEAMSVSANNLHKLLENLLEWSRLQRGVTAFDPKRFFIKTQIEETIKQNIDAANKKSIQVELRLPPDLTLMADINMFSSTLRNLFSNAIKFTQSGGLIKISANKDIKEGIIVSIQDSGIGMKPEVLKKLFKIDEHVNRPGTDGEPSTGLGLILCKDFVEKHGGKIWAESKENEGSTFYFSLPIIDL